MQTHFLHRYLQPGEGQRGAKEVFNENLIAQIVALCSLSMLFGELTQLDDYALSKLSFLCSFDDKMDRIEAISMFCK